MRQEAPAPRPLGPAYFPPALQQRLHNDGLISGGADTDHEVSFL